MRKTPTAILPKALISYAYAHREEGRAESSVQAFRTLGVGAKPAIPALVTLMNDAAATNTSRRAVFALAYIGPDVLPLFIQQLRNTNAPSRRHVACAIGQMPELAAHAAPAYPTLMQCLHDNDPEVRDMAAFCLASISLPPELAVPALTNCLHASISRQFRPTVIRALAAIGPAAHPAQPLLQAALQDPDAKVRKAATNALREIAPEALTNAPAQ